MTLSKIVIVILIHELEATSEAELDSPSDAELDISSESDKTETLFPSAICITIEVIVT